MKMNPSEYVLEFLFEHETPVSEWILGAIARCRDCFDRVELLDTIRFNPLLSVALDDLLETGSVRIAETKPKRTDLSQWWMHHPLGQRAGVYIIYKKGEANS